MMIDQLLRGLKHARRKRLKGDARIGTVSGFLKRMADVCGVEELAAALKLDKARVEGAIKRAAGQFTFFDAEHARPVASRYKGTDGKVVTKGTSLKDEGDGKALSDGSILEFDCVVTTGRRDRDGDVLDPKGAMVDPHLPLLWQHMPFQPIGKMVRLIEQSEDKVTARFKIMDTPLGREAATLIKGDCLRISHGFAPVEYNPLKDENGKDLGGWNITKYAMMECSVVSIPSNVDAEIEQFDAQKMSDPLIKAFYGALKDAGKRKAWAAGFGPVLKAAPAKKKPAAGKKEKDDEDKDDDKRKKEDEDEDRDEKADDDDDKEEKDKEDEDDQDDDDEEKESDDQVEDDEKDEDDASDPDADEDGDGDSEENDSDADASTDGGAVRPLGEIIDGINQLAADKSLPKEAQRRLMVVAGMFEDVDESIAGSADKLAEAAKARDLVSIFTETANLTESCVAHIGRASDELERVMDVDELPDSAKGEIGQAVDDARNIMAAVSMMNSAAQDAQDEADQDGDDDQADADGEADADADSDEGDGEEVAVAESDGSDDDQDDDDDEEKDGDDEDMEDDKDDEPEEDDEKDDDEDDRDEKGDDRQETDDDDENPEAEPAGEENPGTNSGKAASRRRLSEVLGKKLLGMDLTPAERKLLKQNAGRLNVTDE